MSQRIQCPTCLAWADEHEWIDCEVYCEDCGEHMALQCPHCCEKFDEIYQQLLREGL